MARVPASSWRSARAARQEPGGAIEVAGPPRSTRGGQDRRQGRGGSARRAPAAPPAPWPPGRHAPAPWRGRRAAATQPGAAATPARGAAPPRRVAPARAAPRPGRRGPAGRPAPPPRRSPAAPAGRSAPPRGRPRGAGAATSFGRSAAARRASRAARRSCASALWRRSRASARRSRASASASAARPAGAAAASRSSRSTRPVRGRGRSPGPHRSGQATGEERRRIARRQAEPLAPLVGEAQDEGHPTGHALAELHQDPVRPGLERHQGAALVDPGRVVAGSVSASAPFTQTLARPLPPNQSRTGCALGESTTASA